MKQLVVVVALAALAPAGALAWTQSKSSKGVGLKWPDSCLKVYINEEGSDDVDDGSDIDAVKASLDEWNKVECSPATMSFAGFTNITKTGHTGEEPVVNIVIWREKKWPYTNRPVAYTAVTYNPASGEIVDADIEFNGQDFVFTTDPIKEHWKIDIQNAATHELGHVLGLDHSDDELSTMHLAAGPGEYHKRSLNEDDIEGLCTIYPDNGKQCVQVVPQDVYSDYPDTKEPGGCAAGPRGAAGVAPLLLGLAGLLAWRGRRSSKSVLRWRTSLAEGHFGNGYGARGG